MSTVNVALLGTCDTKLKELVFLRDRIEEGKDVKVILIDVGRNHVDDPNITTSRTQLLSQFGDGVDTSELPRGELIRVMSECATRAVSELYNEGRISGIIAAGGSGGTSLASAPMRDALPVGFPKLIVSTVGSGDTGPIVGETDITLMYSVVDIAGLNGILRDILSNAAAQIAAAAMSFAARSSEKAPARGSTGQAVKRVGITMFGVTTPGVDAIRSHLESNYPVETYVFHATGHGGKAMERLVGEGRLDAVLDLTTTEICDLVAGGVMAADESRLEAALAANIPSIISLGATDMVNFGSKASVPELFKTRRLFEHNPAVTLMRTSEDECRKIGEFIGNKLRQAKRPDMVEVWIPRGGVSMLSVPGAAFADDAADGALFDTLCQELQGTEIEVRHDARDVNDKTFARDIGNALAKKMGFDERLS